MRPPLFYRLLTAVRAYLEPEIVCRHRVTQPGDRVKAIAFWRQCAQVWMALRFDSIDGWKPAERIAFKNLHVVRDARIRRIA